MSKVLEIPCGHVGYVDGCKLCEIVQKNEKYQILFGKKEETTKRIPLNCFYRGEEIEKVDCSTCQGKTSIKVFSCDLYHKCTVSKKLDYIPTCSNCPSFVSKDERVLKMEREVSSKKPYKKTEDIKYSWVYGLTTVHKRSGGYLDRTLKSLAQSGFDKPHLFVDNLKKPYDVFGTDSYLPENSIEWSNKYNLPVTVRGRNVRTAANWYLALAELYTTNPNADMYAIFQDDFVCSKNLKRYIEEVELPIDGYYNLYTFPQYFNKYRTDHRGNPPYGWFKPQQKGLGAVALIIPNRVVMKLLASDYFINRFKNGARGHRAVDGGIVSSFQKDNSVFEYCHHPSLVQHIGHLSSMNNIRHADSQNFMGEDFDLLDLIRS